AAAVARVVGVALVRVTMGVSWELPGLGAWMVMRSLCWLATRTSVCPLLSCWTARVVRRPAIWKVPSPLPCRCSTSPKGSPTSRSSKPVWGLWNRLSPVGWAPAGMVKVWWKGPSPLPVKIHTSFTVPGLGGGQEYTPGYFTVPLADSAQARAGGLPVSGPVYLGLRIDPA